MKKVLVTGGAGFIGSNLVDSLINQGYNVSIIDNLSTGSESNLNDKATFYNYDLSKISQKKLLEILEGVEFVFHLAALARVQPSILNPMP